MQEYYDILGINESATDEEIEKAYEKLKNKYSKDRFLEGDAGNEAAKNLTKLENAYNEIKEYRAENIKNGNTTISYEEIEKLIKSRDYTLAQEKLDNVVDRDAEWHYLQSVIFYKKSWINESKKQLEIAMQMDPSNSKYKEAYTKLNQKINYNNSQFHSGNANYSNSQANDNANRQMGGSGLNDCFSFCATWCCMDMLCNMCCH
ncbi:MAG: DnaJ domain-containing protein [Clostridia bacterium]|nr:DnaJ domain-containing protein [Clostridia bacterium]